MGVQRDFVFKREGGKKKEKKKKEEEEKVEGRKERRQ